MVRVPKSITISDELREIILTGKIGDVLPTLHHLSLAHQTTQYAPLTAYHQLFYEGLVKQQLDGRWIVEPIRMPLWDRLYRYFNHHAIFRKKGSPVPQTHQLIATWHSNFHDIELALEELLRIEALSRGVDGALLMGRPRLTGPLVRSIP